jgi:hypothetical protein
MIIIMSENFIVIAHIMTLIKPQTCSRVTLARLVPRSLFFLATFQ